MDIIDLILMIWFIAVGIIVVFILGERIALAYPSNPFSKWWRKHVISILDNNDERF